MKTILSNIFGNAVLPKVETAPRSLSYYFPEGTQYFYGYPAGESGTFINLVPPEAEELVAARPLSCAGSNVTIVCFAATHDEAISVNVRKKLRLPHLSK